MSYDSNYKVLNYKIPWLFKISSLVFFSTFLAPFVISGLIIGLGIDMGIVTPELETLIGTIFIILIVLSGLLTILSFGKRAVAPKENFEDIFADHIGFEYLGTSYKTKQLKQRLNDFEDKRVIGGNYLPYSSYCLKQKDFQVHFCGLTSSRDGRHNTYISCCLIRDKNFIFPDFTFRSKNRLHRFIDFFKGRKNCFEYKGKNIENINEFFNSLKLDPKILSHTGNITIDGRNKSLLIVCSAGLTTGNLGELYRIWNDIYRLFSLDSNSEKEQTEPILKEEKKSQNNQTPQKQIRASNCPTNVKVELDTPLELFLDTVKVYSILAIVIMAMDIFNLRNPLGIPFINACLVCLIVFAISWLLREKLNCYYILDANSQCLLYYCEFGGIKKTFNYGHLKEIHAVTVDARPHGQSYFNSSGWFYRVSIVLASGKIIPISNLELDAFFSQGKQAKQFSELTGAKFVNPKAEKVAKAKMGPDGEYTFEHRPSPLFNAPLLFATMIGILLLILFWM